MGLFESLAGQAVSALGGNQSSGAIGEVAKLINGEGGGLQGLVSQFASKGLGDIVSSWVGTGNNLPISKDQILSVLGDGKIASIAKTLGVSSGDATSTLSTLLPQIIDKLTPDGKIPSSDLIQKGLSVLSMMGK
ncbi:MAG: YidB family protein [Nitrospirota bacterium]